MSYVSFNQVLASARIDAQACAARAARTEEAKAIRAGIRFFCAADAAQVLSEKAIDLDCFGPKAEARKAWTAFRRANKRAEKIRPSWLK
jgi:hypothetical protein